ncbi:MAG: FAD-dependent oxidoreductase [Erysipelotrichaceae bacterium]|nr:FAD-dependent oxidoreductase [Erysipelotrichaceae bacterium]
MKKLLCLLTTLLLVLSGCSSQPAETPAAPEVTEEESTGITFTPGTYQATVEGLRSDITLEVTFTEDRIEDIQILEQAESRIIAQPALERVPAAIIENQSLAVDTISSCTMTSLAVKHGVEECVKQAGVDPKDLYIELPAVEQKDETYECDVVVVGAGMAGLSAALAAADEGAKVVLLEKLAVSGGSSALSGGVIDIIGLEEQKDLGLTEGPEYFVEVWKEDDALREVTEKDPNIDYAHNRLFMFEKSVEAYEFLTKHGDILNDDPYAGGVWGDQPIQYYSANRADLFDSYDAGGCEHTNALTISAEANENITILYSTPAKELITTDGKVTGVIAESKSGKVTVNADSVILATGGFAQNGEMTNRFNDMLSSDFAIYSCASVGCTGDGITMAEAVGADVYDHAFTKTLGFPVEPGFIHADINQLKGMIFVDANGKRCCNNDGYMHAKPTFITDFANAYKDTGAVYDIFDADTEGVDVLEANLDNSHVYKAETLEELAEMIDMDPAALQTTVDEFNALCDAGVDEEFGQTTLEKVETGPFYATKNSLGGFASFGGLLTDDNYQVLNTEGEPIDGLYAVGELVLGKLVHENYAPSISLLNCTVSGMYAAKNALAQ